MSSPDSVNTSKNIPYLIKLIANEFYRLTNNTEKGKLGELLDRELQDNFKETIENAVNYYKSKVEDYLAPRNPDGIHAVAFKFDGDRIKLLAKLGKTDEESLKFIKSEIEGESDKAKDELRINTGRNVNEIDKTKRSFNRYFTIMANQQDDSIKQYHYLYELFKKLLKNPITINDEDKNIIRGIINKLLEEEENENDDDFKLDDKIGKLLELGNVYGSDSEPKEEGFSYPVEGNTLGFTSSQQREALREYLKTRLSEDQSSQSQERVLTNARPLPSGPPPTISTQKKDVNKTNTSKIINRQGLINYFQGTNESNQKDYFRIGLDGKPFKYQGYMIGDTLYSTNNNNKDNGVDITRFPIGLSNPINVPSPQSGGKLKKQNTRKKLRKLKKRYRTMSMRI